MALTDHTGIHQHAVGSLPDPRHGYCTDDVARALFVDLLHGGELGWAAVSTGAWRSLQFLIDAFDAESGRFRNFRAIDGTWHPGPGSEDSHGRAVRALGETVAQSPDPQMAARASALLGQALPASIALRAFRARASCLLGCDAALAMGATDDLEHAHRELARSLRSDLARTARNWPWPERIVTYENGVLPEALIAGGSRLGDSGMIRLGLRLLDWLIESQTARDGHLSIVGNRGWWPRDGVPAQFDQQPIDATALLLASEAALKVTGDPRYRAVIECAYAWFLGDNDTHACVAVPARGACHDGLNPFGVSENEGAELTLMWLIALERVRDVRRNREQPLARASAWSGIGVSA